MRLIEKLLKFVFIFSLVGSIIIYVWRPPLPSLETIAPSLLISEPNQQDIKAEPYFWKVKNQTYKITPLYNYDIQGLVVSEYDSNNWLDIMHKNDPAQTKDLCLIWGSNLKSKVYRDLRYHSDEATCYVDWNNNQRNLFNSLQYSNNHLIPANDKLGKLIRNSHVGDQVQIKGALVNYEILNADGQTIASRNTSTIWNDKGCEIILVSDFEILRTPGYSYTDIKKGFLYTMLISGLVRFVLFFLL